MTTVKEILDRPYHQKMEIKLSDGRTVSGILIEERISRKDIPANIYLYDIRHSDEDWVEPVTLEQRVIGNWFGTLLVNNPIVFPDGIDYLEISNYSFID